MSNRNPPDPNGDARRVSDFCDALALAANDTRGGLCWRPFIARSAVERELKRRGLELCEEGSDHDPRLKRYFAMKIKRATNLEAHRHRIIAQLRRRDLDGAARNQRLVKRAAARRAAARRRETSR